MIKYDLRTGMTVELRDGKSYIVLRDIKIHNESKEFVFSSNTRCIYSNNYDDNLLATRGVLGSRDVMKVYEATGSLDPYNASELLWARKE